MSAVSKQSSYITGPSLLVNAGNAKEALEIACGFEGGVTACAPSVAYRCQSLGYEVEPQRAMRWYDL